MSASRKIARGLTHAGDNLSVKSRRIKPGTVGRRQVELGEFNHNGSTYVVLHHYTKGIRAERKPSPTAHGWAGAGFRYPTIHAKGHGQLLAFKREGAKAAANVKFYAGVPGSQVTRQQLRHQARKAA